jgi:hypothetical protein
MRRRLMFLAAPALLLCAAGAQADVYDFTYVGISDPSVHGSGTFVTGTPYGDGYLPITSINGITEAGVITGIQSVPAPGIDPGSPNAPLTCCQVGPGGNFFAYDNAYMPGSANPFSTNGGLLFDTTGGTGPTGFPLSPVMLFSDGSGNTFEFSYGEDSLGNGDSGGTQVRFSASLAPEPSFYGAVGLCMSGLLFARWRRRKS